MVRCCKAVVPIMRDDVKSQRLERKAIQSTDQRFHHLFASNYHPRILNLISMAGRVSNPGFTPYCASKHAALAYTTGLRLEMKTNNYGVEVMAINPTFHNTALVSGMSAGITSIWMNRTTLSQRDLFYGTGT
jgi:NAD(P)-dependent dehydrogenase (short-subunit alcohol dehydrogenase family)